MEPYETFVDQRAEIQSCAKADFSRRGVTDIHKYPTNTRFEHFDLRADDGICKNRQFMQ